MSLTLRTKFLPTLGKNYPRSLRIFLPKLFFLPVDILRSSNIRLQSRKNLEKTFCDDCLYRYPRGGGGCVRLYTGRAATTRRSEYFRLYRGKSEDRILNEHKNHFPSSSTRRPVSENCNRFF